MSIYFDEFKIFREAIKELENEYYQGLIVINRLPLTLLVAFRILNKFAHTRKMIYVQSDDEQIELLLLICKLASKQQIEIIMEYIQLNNTIWIKLLNINFNFRDCFSYGQRTRICRLIAEIEPTLEKEKYMKFYGLVFFKNLPQYDISNFYFDAREIRIYDKLAQMMYMTTIIDDQIILSEHPHKHIPSFENVTHKWEESHFQDYLLNVNISEIMPSMLSIECAYIEKLYNFIVCDVNVCTPDGESVMQIIKTCRDDKYQTFVSVHTNDFRKLYPNNKYGDDRRPSLKKAWNMYCKNGIYVAPTKE
jgi:hypothetical protein